MLGALADSFAPLIQSEGPLDALGPVSGTEIPGAVIVSSNVVRNADAVFAATFTGLDNSVAGSIAEFGGGGNGAFCAIMPNQSLQVQFGSGSSVDVLQQGTAAGVIIPTAPSGDGTLVVSFDFVPMSISVGARVWWNGQQLQGTNYTLSAGIATWAGDDDGAYLGPTAGSWSPAGKPDAVVTYTTAGNLQYWASKRVLI